ncbi:Tn3 family transposase, partial [Stenotrophomonas maltophilia]
ATRTLIDELLRAPEGSRFTGWQSLKREPGRPTNKEVRFYLQHIRMLQQLADQLPPIDVPVPKLKQFRAMARAYDASELAELAPDKRYALATIFIRAQHAKTLDDAAELFIKQVRGLENTAQQKLLAYQLEHAKRADFLIGQLKEILQAYQLDGSDSQRVDAIDNSLEAEVSTLLAECEEHMAYAGKNYLPFMLQPYGAVRPLLFNGLELMKLRATSHDAGMEPLIAAVLSLRNQRRELIEVASLGLDPEKDFDWMSKLWRQHVFGKRASAAGAGWMHRKYFELAVLVQVKDELKSGDLFIPSSERFDDYREQLVDEATLAQELEAYGQVSGLPTDAESFVAGLRAQLTSLADEVDARFPENVHADILDGRLVLR